MKEWIPEQVALNQQAIMDQLDIRAVLAKIDRDRAETQKLTAETDQLIVKAREVRWMTRLTKLVIIAFILVALTWRLPELLPLL